MVANYTFFKKGIPKVCKAFLSRICHAVVFTQFRYADSKSFCFEELFEEMVDYHAINVKISKWPPIIQKVP